MIFETEYKQYPETLTPEKFAELGNGCAWNFTQCQAFLLNINGREVYFLNNSLTPDNETNYQEYAVVVPTKKRERYAGYDFALLVQGQYIDSLTVNGCQALTADWLKAVYGDPENDDPVCEASFVIVVKDQDDRHLCDYCA